MRKFKDVIDRRDKAGKGGCLFVFEGPDGAGKSTIVSAVAAYMQSKGHDVLAASFPGREPGTIGRLIYELHHTPEDHGISGMSPTSLQQLHIAAHIDLIERIILPALHSNRTVLLDRFWWSTWVYGCKGNVPLERLNLMIALEQLVWGERKPTALFLLHRDDALRDGAILDGYLELAERESTTYPVLNVNNRCSIATMASEVATAISTFQCEPPPEQHFHSELL